MTLDFIKALLWPAVVVIGLFWLFRSQVKTLFEKVGNLFDRMRLQRVKTPGGLEFIFTALETAQAVVQDRVMEGRQAIVQAKDPEERERAVEDLERNVALLGQLRAATRLNYTRKGQWWRLPHADILDQFVVEVGWAAEGRGLPEADRSALMKWVREEVEDERLRGTDPVAIVDELGGSAENDVDEWIKQKDSDGR